MKFQTEMSDWNVTLKCEIEMPDMNIRYKCHIEKSAINLRLECQTWIPNSNVEYNMAQLQGGEHIDVEFKYDRYAC